VNTKKLKDLVFVDDEPVNVSPGATVEDVLRSRGSDPSHQSLVQVMPDGRTMMLRSKDRINHNDGNEFVSTINPTAG